MPQALQEVNAVWSVAVVVDTAIMEIMEVTMEEMLLLLEQVAVLIMETIQIGKKGCSNAL